MTEIVLFDKSNEQYINEAAALLAEAFPGAWGDGDSALEEINECLDSTGDERIAIMAVEDGHLAGFVGAVKAYEYAWELHPLVVHKQLRFQGVGSRLVKAMEKECANRGALTIYLGTDDEFGETSLADRDLYVDTYEKMKNIRNIKNHPFEFYQKNGYKIVGVIPDANGVGKPDIFMAKKMGGSIMEYKIEKWEAMDLLVHAKNFRAETSDKEIPLFWDEYSANEEYRKIPGYLGVCAKKKTDSDEFRYGIGCRASDVEGIPDGFEIIHIPEYSWAVFRCVGPSPDAIRATWDRIYKEWLPAAEYERIPDYDIENYLPGNPAAQDYVSEICIPVKSK